LFIFFHILGQEATVLHIPGCEGEGMGYGISHQIYQSDWRSTW